MMFRAFREFGTDVTRIRFEIRKDFEWTGNRSFMEITVALC